MEVAFHTKEPHGTLPFQRNSGKVFTSRFENSVKRTLMCEELIVFGAFASAYLLAWAASRVFQR